MLIGNFLKNIKKEFRNHQFAGLSFNSADCKKDYIFFAIKGTKSDGNKFIDHAIKKGANTIISEQKFEGIKNKVLFLRSKNVRKLLSELSYKIKKNKPKNLIAVTGTNGKYTRNKINTFAAIFPSQKPRYTLVVMLDEPKTNSEYIYYYRDDTQPTKGTPFNTAGWTSVEVVSKIIERIGPILATKYMEN